MKKHTLVLYFVLAYAISWAFMLPVALSAQEIIPQKVPYSLYNSTGGSLLLVILFHVFFNWLSVSEAGGKFVAILMSAPVVAWAIFVVRRYGPENVAPLPKQVS